MEVQAADDEVPEETRIKEIKFKKRVRAGSEKLVGKDLEGALHDYTKAVKLAKELEMTEYVDQLETKIEEIRDALWQAATSASDASAAQDAPEAQSPTQVGEQVAGWVQPELETPATAAPADQTLATLRDFLNARMNEMDALITQGITDSSMYSYTMGKLDGYLDIKRFLEGWDTI